MKDSETTIYRGWEYKKLGDYHRNLDPNWSYTPTYLRKMYLIRKWLEELEPKSRILDAGCGEGALVEEYAKEGWEIEGLDLNYTSEWVRRGNILSMPYPDNTFDAVMLLDVFEHLSFPDQPVALKEIKRVLKPYGLFCASIPNLAHLNSRFTFFLSGKLDRTDIELNHVGERPFKENIRLIRESGFEIVETKGVTLTIPWIYRKIICRQPARYLWLHNFLEIFARPEWAMLDIYFCKNII